MTLFRRVQLPSNATGQLLLHSMPGRKEPITECWDEIKRVPVHSIVSLTSDQEISAKSASYAQALAEGSVPCERRSLSVPDGGVPPDDIDLFDSASDVAEALKAGQNVLVHCDGGVGRTGMFAAFVLMRLRLPLKEALLRVEAAGSRPETSAQSLFLKRMVANTDG